MIVDLPKSALSAFVPWRSHAPGETYINGYCTGSSLSGVFGDLLVHTKTGLSRFGLASRRTASLDN